MMKRLLKHALLSTVGRATRRTAVLLPTDAAREDVILPVLAPYRVTGDMLELRVCHAEPGEMRVAVNTNGESAFDGCAFSYPGLTTLRLDLRSGTLACAETPVGTLTGGQPISSRRFSLHLVLVEQSGTVRRRTTSHYLPRVGQAVDERYYSGEDYIDYEEESASTHRQVLELIRRHGLEGPILEIGCATGTTLAAMRDAGYEAFGLDFSAWAVERARARVGDAAWACDVEHEPWPDAVVERGPFKCIVMAAVLEHFADPCDVLRKLATLAAPGAGLVITTTNCDSLTHRLLDSDWEGYFDWTHRGVDAVSPSSLRQWLRELGWVARELRTWHLWDSSNDPTHATLRDWHAADARMRALLVERDLGDFIACVAVRP
jgi:2-polyprenyl-3-methyl-5-hydroxy-6-metoxy-1,4-benzoquinol methylase